MRRDFVLSSRLKMMVIVSLAVASLVFWGRAFTAGFANSKLYSSGVILSNNGTALNFSDTVQFKDKYFRHAIKMHWDSKTNTMQESGVVTYNFFGEYDILLNSSSSYGNSVLGELELDDGVAFDRGYMQTGNARVKMVPLTGELGGRCYYMLYMKKVYCGSSKQIAH